jgi:CheY-like chemotaxis protein
MKRLLVIDDSVLIREVARMSLEAGGYTVEVAESGAEGVQSAQGRRPDAILLDVVMPEMDGPETLAALHAMETTRDIPVILVTGRDRPDERERFAALDVAGVIAKPFAAGELAGQVADILEWGP